MTTFVAQRNFPREEGFYHKVNQISFNEWKYSWSDAVDKWNLLIHKGYMIGPGFLIGG